MTVTCVYLDDSKMEYEAASLHFEQAAEWATRQCTGFIGHYVQDVSDFSHFNDLIAEYQFSNSQDAVFFELKWR